MKSVLLKLIAASAVVALLLSGCSKTNSNSSLAGSYVVSNMSELLELSPTEKSAIVILKGYYEEGDGGGGTFYYDAESQLEANGGTVIKSDKVKGRFVRDCEENYVNVKWFGAMGDGANDDTAAIQAAIDSLPENGGTVSLPGGKYAITSALNIGDGNTGDKTSTKHGVKLIGMGGGFSHNVEAATTIIAHKEMDDMLTLNGRISDCEVAGIYFNGNNRAKTCLNLNSFSGCYFHNIKAMCFTDIGIKVIAGNAPTGNYNIYNRFESVSVNCLNDKTTGILIDGNYSNHNDTWLSVFTDCRFDTTQSENSIAAHFKFVDSISFYRCHFNTYKASSTGAVFDALDNHTFPCGMAFYDCSMTSHDVWEDSTHTIRKQYFFGFGTYDNERLPTHPKLIGITDTGKFFNVEDIDRLLAAYESNNDQNADYGDYGEYTLTPKFGNVDTYVSAGSETHHNLKDGKKIAVLVNAKGTLKGASFYLSSYDNNVGTIKFDVYKWDTDYNTTVNGKVLATHSAVNFGDNMDHEISFDGLSSGYYLIVISGTAPANDYGVAVWTKGASPDSITFINGQRVDAGVRGQFITG